MQLVDFNQFLGEVPPYITVQCVGFLDGNLIIEQAQRSGAGFAASNTSKISYKLKPKLMCDGGKCQTHTYFNLLANSEDRISILEGGIYRLNYKCCNCGDTVRSYYLRFYPISEGDATNKTVFTVEKVGQFPRYGQRLPRKADKLLGNEKKLFLKGSASENQGMGIGAFTYYRRVIDSQKNRIFDEIIKVLSLTSSNAVLISEIEEAKAETQFTKAVERIKTSLPDGLNVQGHNPLTLLYNALSDGLHNDTDDECLELAHSIKLVLFEFSERLDSALKENDELSLAVKRLVAKKATK